MGIVRMGPPQELVEALRREHAITVFVETGTYLATTTRWAAARFERVFTVEASKALFEQASASGGDLTNVTWLHGDSREQLAHLMRDLAEPSLLWLDAHWCGPHTHGEQEECPLIDELELVVAALPEHIVLVDDARLFLSAPPAPMDPREWPTIADIVAVLGRGHRDYHVAVIEDVIVAVPVAARDAVIRYGRAVADRDWAAYRTRQHETFYRRAARLVAEAGTTLYRGVRADPLALPYAAAVRLPARLFRALTSR